MIATLRGTISEKNADSIVMECGGVGFYVQLSRHGLDALPAAGGSALIYTHFNLRENAMDLFGFPDPEERDCFRMLINVKNVGPKVALAILSELTPDELAAAVVMGDKASITRAKGIGTKVADLVVLELKDKMSGMTHMRVNNAVSTPVRGSAAKSLEIIEALMALGFTQPEAKHAIAQIDMENLSVEEAITQALKGFAAT